MPLNKLKAKNKIYTSFSFSSENGKKQMILSKNHQVKTIKENEICSYQTP